MLTIPNLAPAYGGLDVGSDLGSVGFVKGFVVQVYKKPLETTLR